VPRPSRSPRRWQIKHADCLDALPKLDAASVDAAITDPPYGIGINGMEWDRPVRLDPTRVPGSHHHKKTHPNLAFQEFSKQWGGGSRPWLEAIGARREATCSEPARVLPLGWWCLVNRQPAQDVRPLVAAVAGLIVVLLLGALRSASGLVHRAEVLLPVVALGLSVVWLIVLVARHVATRRSLASRVRLVVLAPDSFDPSLETVLRCAAHLSRVRRLVGNWLDPPRRIRADGAMRNIAGDTITLCQQAGLVFPATHHRASRRPSRRQSAATALPISNSLTSATRSREANAPPRLSRGHSRVPAAHGVPCPQPIRGRNAKALTKSSLASHTS
jgi:hypothetical protein